jgi:hypothetical protein
MRLSDGCIEESLTELKIILCELNALDPLKRLSKSGLESFCGSLLDRHKFGNGALIHITGRADDTVVSIKPIWTKDSVSSALVAIQDDRFVRVCHA